MMDARTHPSIDFFVIGILYLPVISTILHFLLKQGLRDNRGMICTAESMDLLHMLFLLIFEQ